MSSNPKVDDQMMNRLRVRAGPEHLAGGFAVAIGQFCSAKVGSLGLNLSDRVLNEHGAEKSQLICLGSSRIHAAAAMAQSFVIFTPL